MSLDVLLSSFTENYFKMNNSWTRLEAASLQLPKDSILEEIVLPKRLATLRDHDCMLVILQFLSWEDLNTFSLASRGCYRIRNHASLDQTRSGTIVLGKGVSDVKELIDKARQENWSDTFSGQRTHLRLSGLTHLSSNIDPIDGAFLDTIAPLKQVTSLDCSMIPPPVEDDDDDSDDDSESTDLDQESGFVCFLAPFGDSIDRGFAQGLAISLLVPYLQYIDISHLPLTMAGIAWLTENNPDLEVVQWNHSLIWPISDEYLGSLKHLKEVYLDDARILLDEDIAEDALWNSLLGQTHKIERVSLLGTRWYQKGRPTELSQNYLMKFVQGVPSLRWFRSDLSTENVERLKKDRPDVTFISSY